jgi:hypothetical protein
MKIVTLKIEANDDVSYLRELKTVNIICIVMYFALLCSVSLEIIEKALLNEKN